MGLIYLIHFDAPLHHAMHYLGFVEDDLNARLARHRSGQGAKLLAALNRAGIGYRVVKTWAGDRSLERSLKNRKNGPRLCPICQAARRPDTKVIT